MGDHQMQNMQQMDHSKHSMHEKHMNSSTSLNKKAKIPITKIEESTGYQTDMRVQNPQYRLNDPGIGLRDNGRRVLSYVDLKSLMFKYGERLRITYINDTMMNHPMHLHGLWSDLETGDDNYLPRKHTVVVQPGSKISFRVTVDAKGEWAYHCHLIYHMTDMFRKVIVT